MNARHATVTTLRAAGRMPSTPFQLMLADGRVLVLRQLLRVLPGKRITGIADIDGATVVAKLFIAAHGAQRHWQRELRGMQRLLEHDLPTPKQLAAGELLSGGYYVLNELIENAQNLTAFQNTIPVAPLSKIFAMIGRMHAHGLIHGDAHHGNFLFQTERIFILDGDTIRDSRSHREAVDNLALALAQLPPATVRAQHANLLAAYRRENPEQSLNWRYLEKTVVRIHRRRLRHYLKKCLRDCSQFLIVREPERFVAMVRSEAEFLSPIVSDPDTWLKTGVPLKLGKTATLAMVTHHGRQLVIKRYNIKGTRHALSRCWRPSRAWHSWIEAHRLGFFGIATPRPLAMLERRLGPFRREAWTVTEYCPGAGLADHLAAYSESAPPEAVLENIQKTFQSLADANITHGDLKASNLLWQDGHLVFIDLDAMKQHASQCGFRHAWKKDRQRLLQNWPATSPLHKILDTLTKTI